VSTLACLISACLSARAHSRSSRSSSSERLGGRHDDILPGAASCPARKGTGPGRLDCCSCRAIAIILRAAALSTALAAARCSRRACSLRRCASHSATAIASGGCDALEPVWLGGDGVDVAGEPEPAYGGEPAVALLPTIDAAASIFGSPRRAKVSSVLAVALTSGRSSAMMGASGG